MKRPELIPQDVWEKLTVAEAAEAGLLGAFPDELVRNKRELLCECGDWTMVARLLAENINAESVRKACRIVRMHDENHARQAACQKHELYPGGNFCMHCHMLIDALDKHISANVLRSDRCVKHEVHTFDGNAYCSRCDATESELLDEPLDIDTSEFDPRNELVNTAKREINIAMQMGLSPLELQKALERALGSKATDITHALTRAFHRSNQQDIRPNASAPNSPSKFREDICRNDGPLLPPFEAGEPTDKVTVTMLYPHVSQLGEKLPVVRCSLNPRAEPAHHIECRRRLDGPPSGFQWISHPRGLNAARTRIADEVLSFDLAVRTGEPLAVAAYGLILFALAIGAERERAHVRAVMSEADEAMDAVMRTVREASEGE